MGTRHARGRRTGTRRPIRAGGNGRDPPPQDVSRAHPSFDRLSFTINGAEFGYGAFPNALISFLLVAAVIFFVVVKPLNALMARLRPGKPVDDPTRECPHCLSDVPVRARRCAFCTSEVSAAPAA